MANNPIDTNELKWFLLIRDKKTRIIEPDNSDQANFRCVQGNYARDTYSGNEETLLEFTYAYGQSYTPRMDNNGVLIEHLSSGLDLLLQEDKDFGAEADVKLILEKNDVEFTTGNFDFTTRETDNKTYFKCKVIQNTNQAKIKKREKLNVDLLATTDLDDNAISAIPIQRMLLKAKPLYQDSSWECPNVYSQNLQSLGDTNTTYYFYNNAQSLVKFGIEDDLSFLDQTIGAPENLGDLNDSPASNFGFVRAKNDISNVKILIKNLSLNQVGDADNGGNGFADTKFVIKWGYDINSPLGSYIPFNFLIDENQSSTQTILNQTFTIDFLPSGAFIWIYFKSKIRQSATNIGTVPRMEAFTTIQKYTIDISLTSTAIDSVINAARWIDIIKQNYKAIGSLFVNAPKFDVGGELYDNFCFTKNLIKQDLTKPFNIKLTDTIESLQEVNGDAQINNNEIFGGTYVDFYRNSDMGGFLIKPDVDIAFSKNERYLVNEFNYGYEKYEQDRNEKNTIDAIHTDSQFFPQTQNSINTKEVKLPFVRDAFSIETARKSAFSINNNSDSTDDNIFIVDVIQLAPNTRRKFTRLISYQTNSNEGSVKFLSDNTFRWDLLGFSVGDTIIVNNVSRTVLEITPNILKCTFTGPDFSDTIFQTFDYPLTNVLWTNRTNEGLIFSENLRNADNFSNLRYSIKRNLKYWFPVLATYGKFILNKKIKNTFFKANGEATTQFTGEIAPIKENADILVEDIAELKILNQDLFKTRVSCTFEQAVQLLNDVQNVRGFVRVQSPDGSVIKGYIKEANFVWSLDELDLTLECKNENDFLTVDYSGGILTINEVGYDQKMANIKLYNIFNDYIQFFDTNNVNLCNRTKFDKVLLNGVSYENVTDLVNAIELL